MVQESVRTRGCRWWVVKVVEVVALTTRLCCTCLVVRGLGPMLIGLLGGCASVCQYAVDRGMDLTDIVDLKYSLLTVVGGGAKVEATDYIGIGLGVAGDTDHASEWYGRGMYRVPGQVFFHAIVYGVDDMPVDNPNGLVSVTYCGFNYRGYRPVLISRFRFGLEIIIPGAHVGAYLNMGEVLDFIAGFATVDLANDDGVPKGSPMDASETTESISLTVIPNESAVP